MLLRIGVISMSFAVLLALALGAVLTLRNNSEEVVATESAAASPEATTEQAYQDPRDKMLDLPSPEPEAEPVQPSEPQPEPVSEPEPVSKPNPEPVSQPDPEPISQSKPTPEPEPAPEVKSRQQGSLPVFEQDWPTPKKGEISAANKPRSYDWVPGAVMTLTVNSIGLQNAPVMGNDSEESLSKGVAHVPETSMPWTRSPHRNVYLAGHKLGWPGTGSHLIFYNLNKLKDGDEIVLRDRRDRRYRYRVSEVFTAGPSDSWVMGQELNRDMVTLQTCTGPNFSKRLIVRADRV